MNYYYLLSWILLNIIIWVILYMSIHRSCEHFYEDAAKDKDKEKDKPQEPPPDPPTEYKQDKSQMFFADFVKRLNRRIGGDWTKNGCTLQSITIDHRDKIKVDAKCDKGVAPTYASNMDRCKSLSLNFFEKNGYLTCGPRLVYVVTEEEEEEPPPKTDKKT